MFTGLSAFPITPFKNEQVDFDAFEKLLLNLVEAKVDSICAMGSTGLYPYLSRQELQSVAKQAVELADGIPVMAGIGSLRTIDVIKNAHAVQQAGVNAVLLAPMSYHHLKESEVLSLYKAVTAELSVPLCVYENPGATNFTFSDALYYEVTRLPNVAAIKIPGMPFATEQGEQRLATLRQLVPSSVAIGVSGDKFGTAGMSAGCDLWLTVLGGLFPRTVQKLIELAKTDANTAKLRSERLEPLWSLFSNHKGGLRIMATASEIMGYSESNCLPAPLSPLIGEDRATLEQLIKQLALA